MYTTAGPDASRVLQQHVSSRGYSLARLTFGKSAFIEIDGISCHVARGGYTGEDGFEVSLQDLMSSLSIHIE